MVDKLPDCRLEEADCRFEEWNNEEKIKVVVAKEDEKEKKAPPYLLSFSEMMKTEGLPSKFIVKG